MPQFCTHIYQILLICCLIVSTGCPTPEIQKEIISPPKVFVNQHIPLSRVIDSLEVTPRDISIYVSKRAYELHLLADTLVLKSYPVVFGFNPTDDKRQQGDGCTPEGTFKVRDHYPHKKWSKFIWVDYPTDDSWRKHKAAKAKGKIPDNAAIGGEIGIHGVPEGSDDWIEQGKNWTLGCVSLTNKDINEFYPYVRRGMKIEIEGWGDCEL